MKVNNFFQNIHYFSAKDYNQFDKFLRSPFFNVMKSQLAVYDVVKKHSRYINREKFSELILIIRKRTGYTEATLRKVLSYLDDKCIEYISIQAYKDEKFYKELFISNYAQLNGNYHLAKKRLKCLNNVAFENSNYGFDYYYMMNEKNLLEYSLITNTEELLDPLFKLQKQKRCTLESTQNLIVYFVVKNTINFVNYVFQCNGDNNEISAFPSDLGKHFSVIHSRNYESFTKSQTTTLVLFYKIFKLFNDLLNDELYKEYSDYYRSIKNKCNKEFKRANINILLNYCSLRQRIKADNNYFLTESLTHMFEFIDNQFYKYGRTEYLHPIMYRNYVINCIITNDKAKLNKFIDNQTEKLHPKEKDIMNIFARAHLKFLNGNYSSVLKSIKELRLPRGIYKYDILNLKIKTNYELGNLEEVDKSLHNYKEFLKNDLFLTKRDKERYEYFVLCMKKLINALYDFKDNNLFDFEYTLKLITDKSDFSLKNWITQKVMEFISKNRKPSKPGTSKY